MRPLFGVNGKVRLKKEEKARIRSKKKEKRLDRVGIVRDVRFRTGLSEFQGGIPQVLFLCRETS
jgi:hypothetical protein